MAPIPSPASYGITTSPSSASLIFHSPVTNIARRWTEKTTPTTTASRFFAFIKRQTTTLIPADYGNINSGPSPGTVAGIVLGSVGGFLLLLWLIYTCINFGTVSSSSYATASVVRERRKSRSPARSRRISETTEIRRGLSPRPIRPEIVEERRETRRETRRERSRSLDGSDEVVVIEERSPPRRSKGKRDSKDSGYRTVDPLAYGGGGAPMRDVGRKGSRRSSGR